MEHKKISIITINLDNKEGLEKTINSVINQTYFDKVNYIIIDGGSSDGSIDIIEKYKKHLAYYVSEKDTGRYDAMNKGVNNCDGEYVLFLNSGDFFSDKDVIEKMFPHLDADIVYGDLMVNGKNVKIYPDTINVNYFSYESLPHPSSFIRRELLVSNPYKSDYKIISDWIFFRECANSKKTFKHINVVVSSFFLGGASSSVQDVKKEKERYFNELAYDDELISIVIPCYNQAKYVRDTIISVKASRYKDFSCIIVNDGSTDNSEEVILDEIKGDKRFNYYKIENSGVGHARNFGISKTKSKYILCLDSDDLISPYYIKKGVEFLEKYKNFSIFYANANFLYDDGEEKKWEMTPYCYKTLLHGNMIYCSHIFRRSEYEKTRGYDEEMSGFEDWEFLIQLLNNKSNVYKSDETMFYYRRHDDSRDNAVKKNKGKYLLYIYNQNKEKYHENNLEVKVREKNE